jgi:pimeloyl-ACP methyl ester carboxylesterase/DNA-binding winged helix-turn-helix (wHTH) protein
VEPCQSGAAAPRGSASRRVRHRPVRPPTVHHVRYRFGGHTLDTATLELRRGGEVVDVQPQVFDVLRVLIENRDRVVPKAELLDTVWGTQFVTESAITTRIKEVRQALGDDGRSQRLVKTVHGRGYRFVADVTEDLDDRGTTRAAPSEDAAGVAAVVGAHPPASDAPLAPVPGQLPPTRYATSDGLSIAYQAFGEGPALVLIAGFATNVELQWEHPAIASALRQLGKRCRVVILDKRGVGLSDRLAADEAPSLERRADDLRAVMDDAGVDRATIFGSSEGGALAMVFAAAHPERTERLILHGTWASHQHPVITPRLLDWAERLWGKGRVYRALAPTIGSTATGQTFLARYERQSATPRTARRLLELLAATDVSSVVGAVATPTLVIHRRDDPSVPLSFAEDLTARIRGARLLVLPGRDHFLFSGDTSPIVEAVHDFVVGTPAATTRDRLLAAVLFVDIVGSVGEANRRGDEGMAALIDAFDDIARHCVAAERGCIVKTLGDGFLATFDGPARAVRAACAVRDAVAGLGIEVRAGVHTAEIERRGDDVAGIGVAIASRVADRAEDGTVWVSRTVTDLVAGSGLRFAPRGDHTLAGIAEPWALYEAVG